MDGAGRGRMGGRGWIRDTGRKARCFRDGIEVLEREEGLLGLLWVSRHQEALGVDLGARAWKTGS